MSGIGLGNMSFLTVIVCTGFVWEKPDVPGANLEGLHYVKNIRKAMEFDKLLDSIKTVAVVGATPLGVEMAGNLGHRGLKVHADEYIDKRTMSTHELVGKIDGLILSHAHRDRVDVGTVREIPWSLSLRR